MATDRFLPEPVLGFDHKKSVEIIGFFLNAAGKAQDKMKLIKLLYLADRLSVEKRGKTLNFDDYYSLPHGPIVSSALNGMNQVFKDSAWAKLAIAGDGKTVFAAKHIGTKQLSIADLKILSEIWEKFGHMTAYQLRHWTHQNCPEYTEVKTSRISIDLDEIFQAVGADEPDVRAHEQKKLQISLGKLERMCGN